MRWETRAQGVKKDRAGLAQPVAVCEMSVQHLRGAGTVCKMTMQHLHGLFTVCKMSVQHLHSPFTVCEMTMQHLHGPFTVCGGTMQHLHGLFTVCETIMQHLHGLFTVCETAMQPLHSLAAVCAPLHVHGKIRRRPQTPRLIIRPRLGPYGGRIQYAPTRVPGKNSLPPQGPSADAPPDHSAPSGTVWGGVFNTPLPGYNHSPPTCTWPNSPASADARP